MRRLVRLLPIVATLFAATQGQAADPVATRRFDVGGFRRIELKGSDRVVVRPGTAFSVVASGPVALLPDLDIAARDGTLYVTRRAGNWSGRMGTATVTVTLPLLSGVAVTGSGDMTVAPFRTARFSGAVAGSGDLTLTRIETPQIDLSVTGSGDVAVAGRADRASLSVVGSGDLDAARLETATLQASLRGSGDLMARASGTASAALMGSGDITVHGPARCTVSKAGSGDVRCNAG